MKRVNRLSKALNAKKPPVSDQIRKEIDRMKLQPKKFQVFEDQRRLMREWIGKADIKGHELGEMVIGQMMPYRRACMKLMADEKFNSYQPYVTENRDEARNQTNHFLIKVLKHFKFDVNKIDDQFWLQLGVFDGITSFNATIATKIAVHCFLYAKTIYLLGGPEHRNLVQRAFEGKDMGCFALTEICHGSNVQGCITVAKYEQNTDSFVINTPHERGMKFWIGNAAMTANMSVVLANLIVKGKDYGIHCFIVPIRDDDNDLLPGVMIADCGDKMGLKGVDNGLLSFRNVIIPRGNLLNKITQVDSQGNVTSLFKRKSKRFAVQLAGLSDGRIKAGLAGLTVALSQLTVAARYAAVRRQFGRKKYEEEALLNYPWVQNLIIPNYAKLVVSYFGGRDIGVMWDKNHKNVLDPSNKNVQEMHALISIFKPVATWFMLEGAQASLRVTKEFGVSVYNGIYDRYQDTHINVTWEGDNTVLLQQCASFVLKGLSKLLKGSEMKFETLYYLRVADFDEEKLPDFESQEAFLDLSTTQTILEFKAARSAFEGAMAVQEYMGDMSSFQAWNSSLPFDNNKAALYYGHLYLHNRAYANIKDCDIPENKKFLEKLLLIFDLTLIKDSAEYLLNYMTQKHLEQINSALLHLYEEVKYNMVESLNHLGISDLVLHSAMGHSDGNIYDRLLAKINSRRNSFGRPHYWRELLASRKEGLRKRQAEGFEL